MMFGTSQTQKSLSSSTSSDLDNDVFYDSCLDVDNVSGASEYVRPTNDNCSNVAICSTEIDNGCHGNDNVIVRRGSSGQWQRCSASSDDDERFTHVNVWCEMQGANVCSRTETFYLPPFCRSEEPVASNMDISTGHIVLVSKFQ